VSSPGISRVNEAHRSALVCGSSSAAKAVNIPTPEAKDIFSQINAVYDKVEDLQFVIRRLESGAISELKNRLGTEHRQCDGSRAIKACARKYPKLLIDVDILKNRGGDRLSLARERRGGHHQLPLEHPLLTFEPLAMGKLYCIVQTITNWAQRKRVTAAEISKFPLIGIDPEDPYGPHHGRHLRGSVR